MYKRQLFNSYTEDVLPRAYLYHLPEKLRQMQAQILELIQHVLLSLIHIFLEYLPQVVKQLGGGQKHMRTVCH